MRFTNLMWLNRTLYYKTIICLFVFSVVNLPGLHAQSSPYKFNYLTIDEGLSHTDANDIVQDKNGYIWIATYFGLNRFDGYTVKKFYNDNVPVNNAFKNRVVCIYPDNNGNIWLGTERGLQCFNTQLEKYVDFKETLSSKNTWFIKLYKPSGDLLYGLADGQVKRYVINGHAIVEQKINKPAGLWVSDFSNDRNGNLLLSTNRGLWLLNKEKVFSKIPVQGLENENLSGIKLGRNKELLVVAANEVFLVNKAWFTNKTKQSPVLTIQKHYKFSTSVQIKEFLGDNAVGYWVNTGTGLIKLDNDLKPQQVITNNYAAHGLNANNISKAFIDRTKCLWICTFGGGVNYCDLNQKLFYTLQHNAEIKNSLSGNHVRSILEDGNNLWIGTNANGLNLFDLTTKKFKYFNSYNSPVKLKHDAIASLTFDNEHNLWIGSGAGIDILRPNLKELWLPPGYENFPKYVIETIVKDYYGNIWFGNHINRFGVIWKDKKRFYHVRYYDEGYFIFADKSKPQLLVSSTSGLKRLIIGEEGEIKESFRYQASSEPNSLSSDYTYPVCSQNDSTYWVGTIGGGLNRLTLSKDTYTIKHYGQKYGVFNDVESLEIDNSGRIWMGGNGLECLNPGTGNLIRYDKNDGLQGNSFKVGSSYKGANGRLYFGGINGLNYFYPDKIKTNAIIAQPRLTGILINNKSPVYSPTHSSPNVIAMAVGYNNELKLSYQQNNFVIFFSSMHFANPLKCKYRYKLIGYDKDWNYTDGRNPSAAYSNLEYNNYDFVVEATNNDGVWSSIQARSEILITPPWWKSTLAKLTYLFFFILCLAGIYIFQGQWYRLKRKIAVREIDERKREEIHLQREELYQQQLLFFTNISHEFRTPLTLIMGPLEDLISTNQDKALDYYYQLMFRNAKRLVNLISELMNFKKVADSVIKLKVRPLSIGQFCKDLTWEFQNLANSKGLKFETVDLATDSSSSQLIAPFDVQILEKILFNLLNNSFKYTDRGGKVVFEIFFDMETFKPTFNVGFQVLNDNHRAKKYIYFRVADTGIGISSDSITRIFDRYYRISKNHLGSGVGLALVKSLTQLHKGDIYVYSERYKGTEIIIGIPWGEENYTDSEKADSNADFETQLEALDNSILSPMAAHLTEGASSSPKSKKRVLIVEDNLELRLFLKHAFEQLYHIYEAEDGNTALEIAAENVPDLIISDVMMPGINGIELCRNIKERFETRHIPFIILSAKDALDTKIEGLESGADFYFAKPLSLELLLLTVNNIFEQSETLKQRYTNNYLAEATELVHSEKDKEFLQKLLKLIEDNIEDIDVDFLCDHLHVSRTKLYQKIKGISDQSVGDFIRTIRLKKAIQIMTHEDIAINEVVDRVGFQSSSNFSRAFKKEYGKSPLQFMQSLKKDFQSIK